MPSGERRVIEQLAKQLPSDCTVLHGFETLARGGSRKAGGAQLQQGECDVIVLCPRRGVLVLEVKGGRLSFSPATGQWISRDSQGAQWKVQDPFHQARRGMHAIIEAVESGTSTPKGQCGVTFGYGVVFPSSRVEGPMPVHAPRGIVADATDMGRLDEFVGRALALWSREQVSPAQPLPMRRIRSALLPQFATVPSLLATLDHNSEVLHRLTEQQTRYLEFAGSIARARIDGVAGSGKTMLAVHQARTFASQGARTLLLCYNRSLAEWLRHATAKDKSPMEVATFHELCYRAVAASGRAFDPPRSPRHVAEEFWSAKAADILLDSLDAARLYRSYDAIVVDEGQDFKAGWWEPIELCLADERSRFYVFYDPNQDIFSADGMDPLKSLPGFRLPTNCRNVRTIASWCNDIVQAECDVPEGAASGSKVEVYVEPAASLRRRRAEGVVGDWLSQEGVPPERIAILSPYQRAGTCLAGTETIAGHSLTQDVAEWRDGKGVLMTTIRAFKGLEADAIVIVDLMRPDSHPVLKRSDYYVGCSRARSMLYLIASESLGGDRLRGAA